MRKSLNEVLRDVVTLEVALSRKTEAHVLVRPGCAMRALPALSRGHCRRCSCRSIGAPSSEAARWRMCARSASARSRDWACHCHGIVMRFSTPLPPEV